MTPEELLRDEAKRWLVQATKDLKAAEALVTVEPSRSLFHSQQAAEKAAKALLTASNVPFRKMHDILELGDQCVRLNPLLAPVFTEAENLTDYAVVFRYLDAPREPDAQEALGAVETARRLLQEVCTLLEPNREP